MATVSVCMPGPEQLEAIVLETDIGSVEMSVLRSVIIPQGLLSTRGTLVFVVQQFCLVYFTLL